MSRLTKKLPTRSKDLPDTSALRERILEAVEQAIDRVEDVVVNADVPGTAADTAKRMRKTRAWELAGTAVAAAGPSVVRAAKNRSVRRHSMKAARFAPVIVRTHPVMLGVTLAAAAVSGFAVARRMHAKRTKVDDDQLLLAHDRYTEGVDDSRFDLTEEVTRMEDEGGDPGAYDVTARRTGRFVRASNGTDASSR